MFFGNWIEYTEPTWRELYMEHLDINESYMRFQSDFNSTDYRIYILRSDCHRCPYTFLNPYSDNLYKIDTSRDFSFKIDDKDHGQYLMDEANKVLCTLSWPKLGQFGVYNLTIDNNNECTFKTDKEPVNTVLPAILVLIIYLLLCLFWRFSKFAWNCYTEKKKERKDDSELERPTQFWKFSKFSWNCFTEKKKTSDFELEQQTQTTDFVQSSNRLKSLDIFRGMIVFVMTFVNNSRYDTYHWVDHIAWNGLNFADVVFPSFLWIMGVCLPFSLNSQLSHNVPKMQILKNITKRSIKLFLIGICVNSIYGNYLPRIRIMGILQRFGVCYFICAIIYILTIKKLPVITSKIDSNKFCDLIVTKWQSFINIILMIFYMSLVYGIKLPYCPRGYIGPGGKQDNFVYEHCGGGIIKIVDSILLGRSHVAGPPAALSALYETRQSLDSEGLFGCLTCIVTVNLGVQCGVILKMYQSFKDQLSRIVLWGIILCILGGFLCGFSVEDGLIPINKRMWSISFVFVLAGIDFLWFAFCLIIEKNTSWNGTPFQEFGKNSILLYVLPKFMNKALPFTIQVSQMNTHFIVLLVKGWHLIMWSLVAIYLCKNNIILKV